MAAGDDRDGDDRDDGVDRQDDRDDPDRIRDDADADSAVRRRTFLPFFLASLRTTSILLKYNTFFVARTLRRADVVRGVSAAAATAAATVSAIIDQK